MDDLRALAEAAQAAEAAIPRLSLYEPPRTDAAYNAAIVAALEAEHRFQNAVTRDAILALYARLDAAEARAALGVEPPADMARAVVRLLAKMDDDDKATFTALVKIARANAEAVAALTARLRELSESNHDGGWGEHIGHTFADCPAPVCVADRALAEGRDG